MVSIYLIGQLPFNAAAGDGRRLYAAAQHHHVMRNFSSYGY